MELKQLFQRSANKRSKLLIVPYGIETSEQLPETSDRKLLIVPYGIETE